MSTAWTPVPRMSNIWRMGDRRSYREASRLRLRDDLLTSARELTATHGWAAVRMIDVAHRTGVSRQTVYNEFGDKPGLAEALATAEIKRFVAAVRAQLLAHGADVRAAARAAIRWTLAEAAGDPLVKAILTSARGGADELLPYLTTRSDVILDLASAAILEWASTHLPDADQPTLTVAAESVVRLVVSHIVLPTAPVEQTAAALADVLVRLLGPGPDQPITSPHR